MEDKKKLFPSSSFKKSFEKEIKVIGLNGAMKAAQSSSDTQSLKVIRVLEESAFKIEKEDKINKVIDAVKRNLINIYGRAEIKISEKDFPKLFFIPNYKKEEINKKSGIGLEEGLKGGFSGRDSVAMVFLKGDESLFEKAVTVHHELDHAVGRLTNIAFYSDGYFITAAQIGYQTGFGKENLPERRGLLLEEGIVEENAVEFGLNSHEEIMDLARKEFLSSRNFSVKEMLEKLLYEKEYQQKILSHSVAHFSELFYLEARSIIALLELGIMLNEGKQGFDFRDQLLKGRIDPKTRRRLIQRIDATFGRGTTRRLFGLDRDSESVKSFHDGLQEKIPELRRKREVSRLQMEQGKLES